MGKYSIKKEKKGFPMWVIAVCIILVPVVIIAAYTVLNKPPVGPTVPGESTGATNTNQTTDPVTTNPTVLVPTFPDPTTIPTTPSHTQEFPCYLSEGLEIDYMGPYAGIYMEDGTDEVVSNMMMLILKNTSDSDLQLARVVLHYGDFDALFETTNLPAGQSVVLLERNRHEYVSEAFVSAELQNVLFFSEPMSLMEDKFSISGGNGYLDVTNISDTDITGEVFVYYKNSATDLLYGGITYRVRLSGGISAGETVRVMTSHYHPDRCTILMVSCSE
jgi:hypothetical protein